MGLECSQVQNGHVLPYEVHSQQARTYDQQLDYQRGHKHPNEFISSDLEATPDFLKRENIPLGNRRTRVNYESESDGVD